MSPELLGSVAAIITALAGFAAYRSTHKVNQLQLQLDFIKSQNERIVGDWKNLSEVHHQNYLEEVQKRIQLELELKAAWRRIEALEHQMRERGYPVE